MEMTRRYRVNVGISVKGVLIGGGEIDQKLISDIILQESDALVAELDKRYPPHIEEKK